MKLQRFFVGLAIEADRLNAPLRIPSLELSHQLKSVFRFVEGDKVILFDGSGYDFTAVIESFDKDAVSFYILEKRENRARPECETYLFASIVKKDTFEWIVEKATELGVFHIIPLISERTEKKAINTERLQKIIQEAGEQSGRATLPRLHDILKLADCLDNYRHIKSVVWEPTAKKFKSEELKELQGVYIGPEGGWTTGELELFRKSGITLCSLGPQILRVETAVVAALAQMVF